MPSPRSSSRMLGSGGGGGECTVGGVGGKNEEAELKLSCEAREEEESIVETVDALSAADRRGFRCLLRSADSKRAVIAPGEEEDVRCGYADELRA